MWIIKNTVSLSPCFFIVLVFCDDVRVRICGKSGRPQVAPTDCVGKVVVPQNRCALCGGTLCWRIEKAVQRVVL